jgi:hypothetical protein
MAPEMISRWPVLVELSLVEGDFDGDGRLTETGVERLFAEGRSAYFAKCATVDISDTEVRGTGVRLGGPVADGGAVGVAVSVVEVFPESFTMNTRIRGADGDVAADAWCTVSPGGEVTAAMRDEFIALAHGAQHYH